MSDTVIIDGIACDLDKVKQAPRRVAAAVTHIRRFRRWKARPSMKDYEQVIAEIERILTGERDLA